MSQHFFKTTTSTGIPVTVLAGWDRPMGGFFLVIEIDGQERLTENELKPLGINNRELADEGYLFSNLDYEGEMHPKDFSTFNNTLLQFGINLPQPMLDDMNKDKLANMGNKTVTWKANGR